MESGSRDDGRRAPAEERDPGVEEGQGGGAAHDRLLISVAERYYFRHDKMVEIAREFGLSRFQVARLLEEAERRGAVRITLHRPDHDARGLGARLKRKYGLRHAVVVHVDQASQTKIREAIGREGARLLRSLLADGDVLGVGWGRAIGAVADAAISLPRCEVVQLSGITGPLSSNSMEVVRRFAELTGDTAYPLYTPLLVPSAATARSLRSDHGIAETYARFCDVSVALVAVGSWSPPNSLLHASVSPRVRGTLTSARLQAELGGIFLDEDGQVIRTSLSDQIMSISAPELEAIPTVVAVAGHVSKARAIRAVMRGGFVNALVTDSSAALALLDDDSVALRDPTELD